AQAELLYTDVLQVRRRVLGQQHPDTTAALACLGGLRLDQGRYAEAETLFRAALHNFETSPPPDSGDSTTTRACWAPALRVSIGIARRKCCWFRVTKACEATKLVFPFSANGTCRKRQNGSSTSTKTGENLIKQPYGATSL
ncbi:MAG: tetratricopeptide repeat protein, partial [Acidobacteriaceae bacterium]|nr:tetratricopeptide repeat protein [Acidobacteriaceae bacterium]